MDICEKGTAFLHACMLHMHMHLDDVSTVYMESTRSVDGERGYL